MHPPISYAKRKIILIYYENETQQTFKKALISSHPQLKKKIYINLIKYKIKNVKYFPHIKF